jgi:hypothetical protein
MTPQEQALQCWR